MRILDTYKLNYFNEFWYLSKMRYLKIVGISISIVFIFIACDSKDGQNDVLEDPVVSVDIEQIKERGYLTAIVDNNATSYFLYKGRPLGYEYELLKRFTDKIDVDLRIEIVSSIDSAFILLNQGKGDVVAYNLTVTTERKDIVDFTKPLYLARQVLVQQKPENWRNMKIHEINNELVRDPVELDGKTVVVRESSAFLTRLENLNEEIGGGINIVEDDSGAETEELIRRVNRGEINYTIADEDVAMLSATYYANIDVKTPVSFSQQIAWAVRKNSDSLENRINSWLTKAQKSSDYYVIYNKYFKNRKSSIGRSYSQYSSVTGDKLSPYDAQIKKYAQKVDWDWKLLASLIYQESRFDPRAESWAGAKGLMQLVDNTAAEFGVKNPYDPKQSLEAGTNYINWLKDRFDSEEIDSVQQIKLVLAAYNVGYGHIQDARRLAKKYGADRNVWDDNVEKYLLLKSKEKYFNDAVVKYGYCRGTEPVNYVKDIFRRYDQYQQLIKFDKDDKIQSEESITFNLTVNEQNRRII